MIYNVPGRFRLRGQYGEEHDTHNATVNMMNAITLA
jgi:hypothetical protein